MRIIGLLLLPLLVFSCTSHEKKLQSKIENYTKFIEPKLVLDSLPDSAARLMHEFAITYPAHTKSEKYLYISTLILESHGNYFETAKYCEDYINHFPNGKNLLGALVAAAHNFEKTGSVDKAIKYYDMAAEKFPKSDIARQGVIMAEMLKKGIISPEDQAQYIFRKRDSTNNKL